MEKIEDYVKFDARSENEIRQFFAERIYKKTKKYAGCGALAIEQIYELEKERDETIARYKELNIPMQNMIPLYAIEWGEANSGMSFDQAIRECYAHCKLPIDGADLLGDSSISIEEAKEMYNYSNKEATLSPQILEESLRVLNNEPSKNCSIDLNNFHCYININNEEHEIPIFWIKYIIAKFNEPDKVFSPEEFLEIKKIQVPDIHAEWPAQ